MAPQVLTTSLQDFLPGDHSFLTECLDQHEDCQKGVGNLDRLPKRLIHLEKRNSGTTRLRLVRTQDMYEEHVHYIALSHSWSTIGSEYEPILSTTTKNERQRIEGIDDNVLPPNYRAVVQICRKLGFQYLWIDCFCIIQNDRDDWKEEAPRMGQIYGAAILTISLNTQQDLLIEGKTLAAPSSWTTLEQECRTQEAYAWRMLFWKGVLEGGPVGQRAWCSQERHLSPRMLHLLENGMFIFECSRGQMATNAWASIGLSAPSKGWFSKFATVKRLIEVEREWSFQSVDDSVFLSYWHDFLGDYQNRKLRHRTDNLMALVGIADRMQVRTGWTYTFGIWQEDLPRGLLWETIDILAPGPHPQAYTRFDTDHAPTWSWSSVSGPTSIISEIRIGNFDIAKINSWPDNRGHPLPGTMQSLIQEPRIESPTTSFLKKTVLWFWGVVRGCHFIAQQVQTKRIVASYYGFSTRAFLRTGSITFDVPSEAYDGLVWCLPLVSVGDTCFGLALRKASSHPDWQKSWMKRKTVYHRMGLVRLTLREGLWTDFLPEARIIGLA